MPYIQAEAKHEVENTHKLLNVLAIKEEAGPCVLIPDSFEVAKAHAKLQQAILHSAKKPIGVHISARKPSNRWVEQSYIELIKLLWQRYEAPIMLFWSPGSENNAMHPGDDEKAARIVAALKEVPLFPYATSELPELIAGLSLCSLVVCSDGGAMHVAAGLHKPIVCFFGDSAVKHWHPWKVPHKVLQPASLNAADVTVAQAFDAFVSLMDEYKADLAHPTRVQA